MSDLSVCVTDIVKPRSRLTRRILHTFCPVPLTLFANFAALPIATASLTMDTACPVVVTRMLSPNWPVSIRVSRPSSWLIALCQLSRAAAFASRSRVSRAISRWSLVISICLSVIFTRMSSHGSSGGGGPWHSEHTVAIAIAYEKLEPLPLPPPPPPPVCSSQRTFSDGKLALQVQSSPWQPEPAPPQLDGQPDRAIDSAAWIRPCEFGQPGASLPPIE